MALNAIEAIYLNVSREPARDVRLFPGFFFGGFECSSPINRDGVRIDEVALTGHDLHLREDYRRLRTHGMYVARDGVGWNRLDRHGRIDLAPVLPMIRAAEAEGITVIWDLFHYGYPDDLDPFHEPFVERFAAYCAALARLLRRQGVGERGILPVGARYYTPVNEISYLAWAGGDEAMFAPHATGRGAELKRRLAEASIAGMNAIMAVDPLARFVHCDPLVRVVAPGDAPWLHDQAEYFNGHFVCEAWDILAGRLAPELGGSPRHLDILGVNYYGINQWEHTLPGNVLAEHDPRRAPFSDMLIDLHERYGHPMVVSETSSSGADRARWLESITSECCRAIEAGVELHGICIYPIVGMAEWHGFEFLEMGLWDRAAHGSHERSVCAPMFEALHRLQRKHGRLPLDRPSLAQRRRAAQAAKSGCRVLRNEANLVRYPLTP